MVDKYTLETKLKEKSAEEERKEILLSILKTKAELEINRKNYEFAEGDLIDYYLYQIKANQAKIDYLIKKAKSKNIMLGLLEKKKFDDAI